MGHNRGQKPSGDTIGCSADDGAGRGVSRRAAEVSEGRALPKEAWAVGLASGMSGMSGIRSRSLTIFLSIWPFYCLAGCYLVCQNDRSTRCVAVDTTQPRASSSFRAQYDTRTCHVDESQSLLFRRPSHPT